MAARHGLSLRGSASGWLWLSLAVIVLDQLTKYAIAVNLQEFDEIVLLPVLSIVRFHNEGAAFSILSDASGWQRWFFTTLGTAVSIGIVIYLLRLPARGHGMLAAGLAFVLGGAIGNVIDRIVHGHVIDFVSVYYGNWTYPAFNVADSAITIGAVLLILDMLLEGRRARRGHGRH